MGAKFIPTQKALQTQRGKVKKRVFTAEKGGLFSLEQWFSTGKDLAPKGTFGNMWRHFGSSKLGGVWLGVWLGEGCRWGRGVVGGGVDTAKHLAARGQGS